jgi:hypothetical protein
LRHSKVSSPATVLAVYKADGSISYEIEDYVAFRLLLPTIPVLLSVRFFFDDCETRVSSDCCSGVGFPLTAPREPGPESAPDPPIDGHPRIAKPITIEKKRSDVFVLILVERAARIAVVTVRAEDQVFDRLRGASPETLPKILRLLPTSPETG